MKNKLLEKLTKLVDVKSIVTITLTGVFSYLSIMGKVTIDQFLSIFTVIIMFFFNYQNNKNKGVDDNDIKTE